MAALEDAVSPSHRSALAIEDCKESDDVDFCVGVANGDRDVVGGQVVRLWLQWLPLDGVPALGLLLPSPCWASFSRMRLATASSGAPLGSFSSPLSSSTPNELRPVGNGEWREIPPGLYLLGEQRIGRGVLGESFSSLLGARGEAGTSDEISGVMMPKLERWWAALECGRWSSDTFGECSSSSAPSCRGISLPLGRPVKGGEFDCTPKAREEAARAAAMEGVLLGDVALPCGDCDHVCCSCKRRRASSRAGE